MTAPPRRERPLSRPFPPLTNSRSPTLCWHCRAEIKNYAKSLGGLPAATLRLRHDETDASGSGQQDDELRRRAPCDEQDKSGNSNGEIRRASHRAGPNRIVKRGTQQSDDGSINTAHQGLRSTLGAQGVPEWGRAHQCQQSRQRNRDKRDNRACQAAKGNFRHSAEIRRDREQWSGKRLGCPVACEEPVIRNPSGRYNGVVQQRQHDKTAAENKRAGAVKSIEQGERAFAGGGE
jgi:hypothetical protein